VLYLKALANVYDTSAMDLCNPAFSYRFLLGISGINRANNKRFFNYYSSLCGNDELRAYREFLIFNQQINKLIEFYVFNVEKYKEVYLRENPRILSVCGDNVWNIIGYCFKLDNNGTTVLVIKDRFLETYLELLDLSGATYDIDGSIVLEESASMLS